MGKRTRPPGSVWRRVLTGATALAVAGAVSIPAAAGAPPATSTALYYETQTATGRAAIDRVSLAGRRIPTQVVALPDVGVFGIAVAGGYVYWVTETAPADRGSIMRATVAGRDVRRLVRGLPSPNSIVAAGGFVYWSDRNAIGRVALDGSHVTRRFLTPSQERGGGVADGLASDGAHLYFSRCTEDAIGRADLNQRQVTQQFIVTGPRSCPQGLAIAGGHVYWTQLGSGTIGRAALDGSGLNGRWLNIHSDQGPFQLAVDTAHVYWTWGGVNGSPAYTGRANANRSHMNRRFLLDSIYPLALAGGA
jgi:hypothetical protein